jgi:release factor glutamine methyltransferase
MLDGLVEILATDRAEEALMLARENAVAHAVGDAIVFVAADLLPSSGTGAAETFDLILANLPYIPSGEIERLPIAASFEPRSALDGGADGLDFVRSLVSRLPDALLPNGVAFVEIGETQAEALAECVRSLPAGASGQSDASDAVSWSVQVLPDLAGRPRLARIERRKT